jgi:NADPH:quinone reductase-like Zn-dependent oxidoreductase
VGLSAKQKKVGDMSGTMKALAASHYGPLDQLQVVELPIPEPAQGEIRVRVSASALNPADFKVILGTMKFLHGRNFPMVMGYDFSGTIETLGSGVESFKVGDEVFGFLPYGMKNKRGAFAETIIAKAVEVAFKPANVSHAQAAASATPGLTAIQSLRDLGGLKGTGTRILVNGVSGGVGSIAIGIAKRMGATVTAVGAGGGLDLARKLGAETVIDRKSQDVFAEAKGPFDVVLDSAAAYHWSQWQSFLKPGGAYVTTLPSLGYAKDMIASLFSSTKNRFIMVKSKAADLKLLGDWLASGLEVHLDSAISVKDVARGLERLRKGETVGRVVVDVLNNF